MDAQADVPTDGIRERFAVRYDGMALAVYREIAAHLRCISGVEVELEWNRSTPFRYTDSQIGAMWVQLGSQTDEEQVRRVLDHYGSWQRGLDLES